MQQLKQVKNSSKRLTKTTYTIDLLSNNYLLSKLSSLLKIEEVNTHNNFITVRTISKPLLNKTLDILFMATLEDSELTTLGQRRDRRYYEVLLNYLEENEITLLEHLYEVYKALTHRNTSRRSNANLEGLLLDMGCLESNMRSHLMGLPYNIGYTEVERLELKYTEIQYYRQLTKFYTKLLKLILVDTLNCYPERRLKLVLNPLVKQVI